jgi:hypothetical protein
MTDLHNLSCMRISNAEWESFREACESTGMLMRDGGAAAIRQWTKSVESGGDELQKVKELAFDLWQVVTGIPVPNSELGSIPERVKESL